MVSKSQVFAYLINFAAGSFTVLAFAPFEIWAAALIGPAVLAYWLRAASAKDAALYAFNWFTGFWSFGIAWLYDSIHDYGEVPVFGSIILVALFVMMMTLFGIAQGWLTGYLRRSDAGVLQGSSSSETDVITSEEDAIQLLCTFPILWIAFEWIREWILTGFPWLYIGVAMSQSPLEGLLPVGGSYLASLGAIVISGAVALIAVRVKSDPKRVMLPMATIFFVLAAAVTGSVFIPSPDEGEAISVRVVQPAVPIREKWVRGGLQESLIRSRALSQYDDPVQLVIWPETAIPSRVQYETPSWQMNRVRWSRERDGMATISGALYVNEEGEKFNSAVMFGDAGDAPDEFIHKHRLVPFGEYVPLEDSIRGVLRLFDLPESNLTQGPYVQDLMTHGLARIAVSICYEVAYPHLVRHISDNANILVTISNDAWWEHANQPAQHMQMAQARALENGRWMLRATNTGVSGVIAPDGEIVAVTPYGVPASADAVARLIERRTPWGVLGGWISTLVVAAMLVAVAASVSRVRRRRRANR